MKTVRFPILKLFLCLTAGIFGCIFLVYIMDVWFDGVVATMLYDSFVGINYYYTETGESYVSEYIILSHVYWALLFCLVFLVCGMIVTLFLVSYRQKKKQEGATILETGKLIRSWRSTPTRPWSRPRPSMPKSPPRWCR